ncbi:MAG TPA: SURF1 family protein [Nevskia sp.]|nr:SURF1 family protein [Nevskia sp.]
MRFVLFLSMLLLACAGFVALGNWQLRRLAWKEALIARVDQRLAAPAEAPPPRAQWAALGAADAYRKLCLDGAFLPGRETLVQAVTRLGPGWWVLAPLRTAQGDTVLVNRGFVDAPHRDAAGRPAPDGAQRVCGLLRLSEPGGAFLHHNAAAEGRWYSRDVAAIAAAQRLPAPDVAPYFLDADDGANPGGWPVGGLTVVQFRNSHLSYALTWYALALLSAGAAAILVPHRRRRPAG